MGEHWTWTLYADLMELIDVDEMGIAAPLASVRTFLAEGYKGGAIEGGGTKAYLEGMNELMHFKNLPSSSSSTLRHELYVPLPPAEAVVDKFGVPTERGCLLCRQLKARYFKGGFTAFCYGCRTLMDDLCRSYEKARSQPWGMVELVDSEINHFRSAVFALDRVREVARQEAQHSLEEEEVEVTRLSPPESRD